MIKHISFDLWLTLIKSHPQFKRKRAEIIADRYCDRGLSAAEIDKLIRQIDKKIDRHNEQTGTKMPAVEMYYTILKEVNAPQVEGLSERAAALEMEANDLFIAYPPHLLSANIVDMLRQLREDGYTLNISSNTGFIENTTLRIVLDQLGILEYFSFFIFSDEIKASKPSADFFQKVYDRLDVLREEVLHVGDNKQTDYQGALNFGFKAYLISTNNYSIDDIRKEL